MPFRVYNPLIPLSTGCAFLVGRFRYFLVEPWTAEDGRISFTKCLIGSIVIAQFMARPFSTSMAAVLISASYGYKAWTYFLDSKTLRANANENYSVQTNVGEQPDLYRDDERGDHTEQEEVLCAG